MYLKRLLIQIIIVIKKQSLKVFAPDFEFSVYLVSTLIRLENQVKFI